MWRLLRGNLDLIADSRYARWQAGRGTVRSFNKG